MDHEHEVGNVGYFTCQSARLVRRERARRQEDETSEGEHDREREDAKTSHGGISVLARGWMPGGASGRLALRNSGACEEELIRG
jgi:hypothetical protein